MFQDFNFDGAEVAQPADDEDMRRFSEVEAVNASRAEGDVTVEEGGTVLLQCRANGIPTPTITWFRAADTAEMSEPWESKKCRGLSSTSRNRGPGDLPLSISLASDVVVFSFAFLFIELLGFCMQEPYLVYMLLYFNQLL